MISLTEREHDKDMFIQARYYAILSHSTYQLYFVNFEENYL